MPMKNKQNLLLLFNDENSQPATELQVGIFYKSQISKNILQQNPYPLSLFVNDKKCIEPFKEAIWKI